MKFNEITRELRAGVDRFIAKNDLSEVYGDVIYLGIYDTQYNYIEVNKNQRDEILAKIEEARQIEEARMNEVEEPQLTEEAL